MNNELQSLSLLFQNKLFRIPDYQRGYAWKNSQLSDFWDDLINLQSDRYHYTGLLSLKILSRREIKDRGCDLWMIDKGFKACHIVDGQQRLTTSIILLNEIINFTRALDENKYKNDEEILLGYESLKEIVSKYICQRRPPNNQITTYLFGYENDNPSAEYLCYRIFNEPFSGTVNETYYTKNLKYAKNFFQQNLLELYKNEGMDGINNLYSKLTLKVMFNVHEIEDDYDVFIAFETMNNRGKKLTNLELLKNRLIYLTTLYSNERFDELEKKHLRTQINDAWKEIYYQLGRNENFPLSDDEFLRAHWIIYFTYSRNTGDDYIKFLLNKFAAKNIFEKKTIVLDNESQEYTFDAEYDEDVEENFSETELVTISKLEPAEISDYVNSLKDMAKYWYDTFFPMLSNNLTKEEKVWVDRLNRISIGYFRPLIAVVISRRDFLENDRVRIFKAIERFLFICFRMGNFNASYCSSKYYRLARSLYFKELEIENLIEDIIQTTNNNIEYAVQNFVTKINKLFLNNEGFYSWKSLKYFLYEYEYSLAKKNNIDKINWEMFTRSEKDRITIEHILPQTPTKYYWRNLYRQFNSEEKKILANALGNLLPLSQSVNSSLQNDSFEDKKISKTVGRRGYENGSHSEIEVSKVKDWTAQHIYERSKALLQFMENRWEFSFTKEQFEKLLFVNIAVDGRAIPDELPKNDENNTTDIAKVTQDKTNSGELENLQLNFWKGFVDYCNNKGRGYDIASRKPLGQSWYDVSVGANDFYLSFTITYSKYLSLLIYAYNSECFLRLERKKSTIESEFGDKLDWYSSSERSTAKRIIYKREADIYNPSKQSELFAWMIDKFDALKIALVSAGELENAEDRDKNTEKFSALKLFLLNTNKDLYILSFEEIEHIIGCSLCNSAYKYPQYWHPSPTHTLPNTILNAGYKITNVNLADKSVILEKIQ